MRQLIYIHGAGAQPGDLPWPRIAKEIGSGWRVTAPDLGEPDPQRWMHGIDVALEGAADNVVLVAHSLGVSVLIQTIALRRPGLRAAGLVGISAPFWGEQDWDVSEYVLPDGFADKLSGIGRIVLFQSRDDEIVDFSHLAVWGRHLARAELRAVDGADHVFGTGDVGPIAAVIREL